jgi:MoaA/NifB/PqqE/SkfB family radical SAM enzyme
MRIGKWAKAALRAAWHRTATVNLIVTRRCDLACGYCQARGKGPELTPDEWLRIARRLAGRYSVFTVSGGEPLLYKALPELINGLSRIGIAGLCTNARLLDEGHLRAMHGLDYLNFSIDHTGDAASSKKTAFGKLPLLAHYARRNRFELRGTAVVTSRNCEAIPAVVRELADYGIPLNLVPVQNPGPQDAFDTPAKVARLEALQQELLAMKRDGLPIDESDAFIQGMAAFAGGSAGVTCHAGSVYMAVDSDGRPMPCQDVAAVGEPLHLTRDIDAALRTLPQSVPAQCRCWWNCYERYAQWQRNPWSFLARSALEGWAQPRKAPRSDPGLEADG